MTDHPDPDFTLAGTPLHEWLGRGPHEATIKAAEQALELPGVPFIVAIFREPSDPAHTFGTQQRQAVRVWFHRGHPGAPGRMRFSVQEHREPGSAHAVKVAVVIYEPDYRPRAKGAEE